MIFISEVSDNSFAAGRKKSANKQSLALNRIDHADRAKVSAQPAVVVPYGRALDV
jgi:hypothetical protein